MSIILKANKRNSKESCKKLRKDDGVPAVLYGPSLENIVLSVNLQEFIKTYRITKGSTIIDLEVDGKSIKSLVYNVDIHPVSGNPRHIDFFAVDMDKEIKANISVKTTGTSEAVKTLGGTLSIKKLEIPVKCLPKDLVSFIEVDISILENLHNFIAIKDISFPNGITPTIDKNNVVISIIAPKISK